MQPLSLLHCNHSSSSVCCLRNWRCCMSLDQVACGSFLPSGIWSYFVWKISQSRFWHHEASPRWAQVSVLTWQSIGIFIWGCPADDWPMNCVPFLNPRHTSIWSFAPITLMQDWWKKTTLSIWEALSWLTSNNYVHLCLCLPLVDWLSWIGKEIVDYFIIWYGLKHW